MTLKLRFDEVSKRYRLGLTRTSLPTLLADRVEQAIGRRQRAVGKQGEFWALKDVSFELHQGESLALIGRNGAGKTTILKLLANITKPTSGTVETYGQLSALIELGAGFHPDLTGRENIYLNGAILGLSRQEINRRFDEMVAFSELDHFIDTPVKRYSSGMTVRLGFAVASCIEPDILLVDEVLAVGDASFQQKCMRRIRELLDNGTSIIFVSHNFYLVQAVCERAIYLTQGQVRTSGPTQEVLTSYEQDLHAERARKLGLGEADALSDEVGDIEITRVEVLGMGEVTDGALLPSDEAALIRIHYNAYRTLGNAHVSVFVTRSDGLTCCMLRTKLDGFEIFVEQGPGTVTVTLDPLQLVSGTYFAEAWFLNESDSMGITTRPGRSDWFQVQGTGLSYTETSGIFEPHTRWNHARSNGYHAAVTDTSEVVRAEWAADHKI